MNLRFLNGFALVTETRIVRLAAGETVLRFEGVADGIVPASAVITRPARGRGREESRCAPAFACRADRRHARPPGPLRRTDKATRQGARGAGDDRGRSRREGVVLQTESGIETLRCSGLGEKVRYDGVPAGLSARPVLSVTTRSPRADDREGNPVLSRQRLRLERELCRDAGARWPLARSVRLADARQQQCAGAFPMPMSRRSRGSIRRQAVREIAAAAASKLELHCFPLGTTTSDLPTIEAQDSNEIIVTGLRMHGAPSDGLQHP
jgi:hypothetical protein